MRPMLDRLLLGVFLTVSLVSCSDDRETHPVDREGAERKTGLAGPYFGQEPPGSEPTVFAPGVASTAAFELNSAFNPEATEFYQTLVVEGWSFSAIVYRRQGKVGWAEPQVAPFSGRYNDVDPNLSPDGKKIYFISRRPAGEGTLELSAAWDIWMAERPDSESPWSEARRLPEPVNSPTAELYPSVSHSGNLYFGSNREGGYGSFDIYRAALTEGGYTTVENLGRQINSEHSESDAFVAPDESFLVVTVTGRPESRGKNDLYISFRQEDGAWGKLHQMGNFINTPAKEYCPVITPDGRFFFFTRGRDDSIRLHSDQMKTYEDLSERVFSWRNNLENIYWVDASILQRKLYE